MVGLDDLMERIVEVAHGLGDLLLLVAPWACEQPDVILSCAVSCDDQHHFVNGT